MEWIAGFLIAVTVGLTGIGGGSFTVPVLVLAGLPAAEAVRTAMIFAASAGAGALGTILLLNFSEMPVGQAVGTDILFGIVLAVVGSAFHLGWGSVSSTTLVHLLAGGLPGALLGSIVAKHVPGAKLRTAVAFIAIVLGLQLVWTAGHNLLHPTTQKAMLTKP